MDQVRSTPVPLAERLADEAWERLVILYDVPRDSKNREHIAAAIRAALDEAAKVARAECQHPVDERPTLACIHVGAPQRIAAAIEAL